jgi:hypothetical protein
MTPRQQRVFVRAQRAALIDLLLVVNPKLSNVSISQLVGAIVAIMEATPRTIEAKCHLVKLLVSDIGHARPHPRRRLVPVEGEQ